MITESTAESALYGKEIFLLMAMRLVLSVQTLLADASFDYKLQCIIIMTMKHREHDNDLLNLIQLHKPGSRVISTLSL